MDTKDLIDGLAARAGQLNPPPVDDRASRSMRATREEIASLEAKLGLSDSSSTLRQDFSSLNERLDKLRSLAAGARVGTATSPTSRPARILAEYRAITNPAEKVLFYRANAAAIDVAVRSTPSPAPSPRPLTGFPTIDEMNAIQDTIDRLAFYRANEQKINSEYRKLNRHQ